MQSKTKFLMAAALATVTADFVVPTQRVEAATIASIDFEGESLFGGSVLSSALFSTGYLAEVGTGTVYGVHTVTNSVWSFPVGNGSINSASSTGWTSGNSFWEIEVPTEEYKDIMVKFDMVSSSTGPRNWKLQYKVGTAGAYVDVSTFSALPNGNSGTISNAAWSSSATNAANTYNFDLSAVSAIEEVSGSNVFFRLLVNGTQVAGSATTAFPTTGTNRIDNVLISGTQIPEPAAAGLLTAAASALLARRRKA
jgi:hypothetical protein